MSVVFIYHDAKKKAMNVIIIPVAEGVEYREVIILCRYQISHTVSRKERPQQLNRDKVFYARLKFL